MPVYNEAACIEQVLGEWGKALRAQVGDYTLIVIDDGSTDATPALLEAAAKRDTSLHVIRKENTGHGESCVFGYARALEGEGEWILQIDSDGQCDPRYFLDFWTIRRQHAVILGDRVRREDGVARAVISRVLSALVSCVGGVRIRDANAPYRLMRRDALAAVFPRLEAAQEKGLANVLLTYLLAAQGQVYWQPISFRRRYGGYSHYNWRIMASRCWKILRQLRLMARERRGV